MSRLPECLECGKTIGFKKIQLCDKDIQNLLKLIKEYTDENDGIQAKDIIDYIKKEKNKKYMSMEILNEFINNGSIVLNDNLNSEKNTVTYEENSIKSSRIQYYDINETKNKLAEVLKSYDNSKDTQNLGVGMHYSRRKGRFK